MAIQMQMDTGAYEVIFMPWAHLDWKALGGDLNAFLNLTWRRSFTARC